MRTRGEECIDVVYEHCGAASSPKKEGLIFVGTDDGLIQVTSDAEAIGLNMRRLPES